MTTNFRTRRKSILTHIWLTRLCWLATERSSPFGGSDFADGRASANWQRRRQLKQPKVARDWMQTGRGATDGSRHSVGYTYLQGFWLLLARKWTLVGFISERVVLAGMRLGGDWRRCMIVYCLVDGTNRCWKCSIIQMYAYFIMCRTGYMDCFVAKWEKVFLSSPVKSF